MHQTSLKLKQFALAAALCAATAAPAMAQTNVTAMGLVDVFAGSMRNAGDANARKAVDSGGMTTSWFGFKGSEDLGGGLKANFLLTSFFKADTGVQGRFPQDTMWSRDANVGLSGGFGAISFGRELAPHFLPTILFNPFGDSYTFAPLILHADVPVLDQTFATRWTSSIAGDTGWSNSIRYTTPDFGGLKANLHYQLGEQAGNNGVNNIGANALYFNGPLALTAFYHTVEVDNPRGALTATRQKAWMLGGTYDLKAAKLFATYGQTSHNVDLDDKTLSLGATVPLGAGKILASWAQTKREVVGPDQKRTTAAVGYDYDLSKRTDLYAIYMNDRMTNQNSGNSFGVGIRHRF